ncbi:MAG: hypothetical protein JNJ63_00495 [Hyphomonadaceae bacterium]|nr:hypothetical protein [Hyphomonadaceae bacterium]
MSDMLKLLIELGESPSLRSRYHGEREAVLAARTLDAAARAALMSGAAVRVREAVGLGGAEPPKIIVVPAAAYARAA